MSGGIACHCPTSKDPTARRERWLVIQRRCNHSAFNGYHQTPSYYSSLVCQDCRAIWRTKATYVGLLRDAMLVNGDWAPINHTGE